MPSKKLEPDILSERKDRNEEVSRVGYKRLKLRADSYVCCGLRLALFFFFCSFTYVEWVEALLSIGA